jgi:flagellar biosynthesis/type III secretory pathway chaperone
MEDLRETLNANEKLDVERAADGMGDVLGELSSVLEKEIGCYTDLLETTRSEQKAIIYGKLDELKLAIEAEENLIASSRALDEVRQNIVGMIAREIGCDGPGLTLKEIIERAGPEQKGKLNSLRDELRKLTHELDFVNRGNAQLIKSSIDFINETMWILLDTDKINESVYDSEGREQQKAKRRVLVDKLG